jgi:hypothetical protein
MDESSDIGINTIEEGKNRFEKLLKELTEKLDEKKNKNID